MRLASRFQNANQFRSDSPITNDQLMRVAPSIFATEAHSSRSERYAQIPTITVLDNLRREGFQPHFVVQANTRVPGKAEFTKHLIRLRHASLTNRNGEAIEVVMINSHDGTSAYQLFSGVFRFICMNGMVCGDMFDECRVHHTGKVVDQVIEASYTVLGNAERVVGSIEGMKQTQLSTPERMLLAESALAIRYDDPEVPAPVTPSAILSTRRSEDRANNVWTTFNTIQENLTQGGLRAALSPTGRRQRTRAVNGINENTSLNRALWTLAERMRDLKAGVAA